jgi:hypothetical protein
VETKKVCECRFSRPNSHLCLSLFFAFDKSDISTERTRVALEAILEHDCEQSFGLSARLRLSDSIGSRTSRDVSAKNSGRIEVAEVFSVNRRYACDDIDMFWALKSL